MVSAKYGTVTVERPPATQVADGEPVFLLLGRDAHALKTLERYLSLCVGDGHDEHLRGVEDAAAAFRAWQAAHPGEVHAPT